MYGTAAKARASTLQWSKILVPTKLVILLCLCGATDPVGRQLVKAVPVACEVRTVAHVWTRWTRCQCILLCRRAREAGLHVVGRERGVACPQGLRELVSSRWVLEGAYVWVGVVMCMLVSLLGALMLTCAIVCAMPTTHSGG